MAKEKNRSYKLEENAINIFTDGSCFPKPRRGGRGILFVITDSIGNTITEIESSEYGEYGTTISRMELSAFELAIRISRRLIKDYNVRRIIVFTDSQYVRNGYNIIGYWARNGWKKSGGAPLEHVDLWKKIAAHKRAIPLRIDIEWVKSHASNPYNKRADKLARKSAQQPDVLSRKPIHVRKKLSQKQVQIGSVEMLGQRIQIRIISEGHMGPKREFTRYTYEVMSKHSRYYQFADKIYSRYPLRAGHAYIVVFNKDQGFPQIKSLIREVVG